MSLMKLVTVMEHHLPKPKIIFIVAAMLVAGLLPSCVTTTTGGFLIEPSSEQAVQDYLQLAIAYYDADDLAGARRHINNAMDIDDRNSDIYTVLALVLQREGDIDLAEDSLRRAIRLDRNNSRAKNNYAALLFSLDRFEEAYNQLEQVTRDTNYTGRAIAFENLGRSALRTNREDVAVTAFGRALQLNSNLYVSALELALLKFKRQDWDGSRLNYQQYLTIVEFYIIPHTPRALLAGIQIEGHFHNQEMVDSFGLVLRAMYPDSPEYQTYIGLDNAH